MTKQDTSNTKGHSEDFFGNYRNYWWNQDFLELISKRLNLKDKKNVLDVGCGQCHWSKILVNFLHTPSKITAIDNDIKWANQNPELEEYFKNKNSEILLQKADAHNLPFKDNSFDMVTCQTVLIHVADPKKVLSEMKRVLKPGGTILCVEPNNLVQSVTKSSLTADASIEETLDHIKYSLICEEGKKKLGKGNNSLGDLLPGIFKETGLKEIEVRLSDKAIPMYPPYDQQEQVATLQQWATNSSVSQSGPTDHDYFKAFGNKYEEFYKEYQQKYRNTGEKLLNAIMDNRYHSAGGAIMYIVSGTK